MTGNLPRPGDDGLVFNFGNGSLFCINNDAVRFYDKRSRVIDAYNYLIEAVEEEIRSGGTNEVGCDICDIAKIDMDINELL